VTEPLLDAAQAPAPQPERAPEEAPKAPALSERYEDPWAHRRGEPRVFMFLWTLYVTLCVLGSILWLSRVGSSIVGAYGPAARIMLIVVAIGATVLWPMTRLSQASPTTSPVRAVFVDAIVVLLPILMVLPPTSLLSGWPVLTLMSMASVMIVWVAVTGGLLAIALAGREVDTLTDPRVRARSVWMTGFVAIAIGVPIMLSLPGSASNTGGVAHWSAMLSPTTALMALTGTGYQGPGAALSESQSLTLLALWTLGAALWWGAAWRSSRHRA
jgi:hypothetical protein